MATWNRDHYSSSVSMRVIAHAFVEADAQATAFTAWLSIPGLSAPMSDSSTYASYPEAVQAAERLVQLHRPHDCADGSCRSWRRLANE